MSSSSRDNWSSTVGSEGPIVNLALFFALNCDRLNLLLLLDIRLALLTQAGRDGRYEFRDVANASLGV